MLIDQLNVGGTETHVLSLAKQLLQEGVNVLIGTSGGPLLDTFERSGLDVVHFPFLSDDPVGKEYQGLLEKMRELITSREVSLLHTHSIASLKVAVQAGQELLVPTVATIHGTFYPPRKLRGILDRCAQVIAVSGPVVEWLTKKVDYPLRQITLIPNGVETEHFKPGERLGTFRSELELTENDRLAVLVSRLAWGKTQVVETAIQAVVQLQPEYPIHLAVVGSGAHTPLVHAAALLANRTAKNEVVNVLGWRLNTLECYQSADLVIGTARVALEALSCGRPVIAAGNASYVGYLEPNQMERAWASYFGDHRWDQHLTVPRMVADLRHVLKNVATFSEQAPILREWVVERFEIKDIASRTLELYRNVLTGGETTIRSEVPKSSDVIFKPQAITSPSNGPSQRTVTDPTLLATKPRVSVAIPAYNRASYLGMCLDSISAQTYRPIEIVVVNDGSTDDTETVAKRWWEELEDREGLSFVYLGLPHNTGYPSAQSIAYRLTTGEYIANQDSDDLSHPQRLEKELLFLLANNDYSFVGCNFSVFQTDIEFTKHSHMLRYGYENILNTYRDGGHCVCFGSLLFKRSILTRIGGLTAFLKGAEDYEWIARALNQGFYVDNLSEPLYYYREHAEQYSRRHSATRRKLDQAGRSGRA